MSQNIKLTIIVSMFIIGAFGLSAQTDSVASSMEQGEIVMTKSELINFLTKIAEAREEKLRERDLEDNIEPQYARSSYGVNSGGVNPAAQSGVATPAKSSFSVQDMSRDDLIREIQALNSRLNYMPAYSGRGGGGNNSTTFITAPGNSHGRGYYPYQSQGRVIGGIPSANLKESNNNEGLRWKIDSLQREVSMLSSTPTTDPVENRDEISQLNRKIDQMQDSLISASKTTPEEKEIIKEYGTSQMQVFFDNDASNVTPRYYEEVQKVADLLKRNSQLEVVLKGYASPVGNAKYNYDLSMRRNEAVKRMLIDYGVFPDQISSVFYGEDKSSSASNARRVDIKFIIK